MPITSSINNLGVAKDGVGKAHLSNRSSLIIATIFFLSGFSSLLFEMAWQRLLTLHYGVGSLTATMIVSVYMVGLGFGALLGGKIADKTNDPRRIYCLIELSLAAYGLSSVALLDKIGQATSGAEPLCALVAMTAFLLFPTMLMGMTLPLVIRTVKPSSQSFLNSLAFLYTTNTCGGAIGAPVGSFVIISFFGLDTAVYAAVAIDCLLAFLLFALPKEANTPADNAAQAQQQTSARQAASEDTFTFFKPKIPVPILAAYSGFLAIAFEIVLFRFVDILSKASPYTFSTNLAFYLSGIGLGSCLAASWLERTKRRQSLNSKLETAVNSNYNANYEGSRLLNLFFILQTLTGLYVVAVFIAYFHLLKTPDICGLTSIFFCSSHIGGTTASSIVSLVNVIFILIPCTIMGASFPILSAIAYASSQKCGSSVGTTYFANTIGNVCGGLTVGFLLFPSIGTEGTLLLLGSLGMCSVLGLDLKARRKKLALVSALAMLITAAYFLFPRPGELYLAMHKSALSKELKANVTHYIDEGRDGLAILFRRDSAYQNFINGNTHGSKPDYKYHREFFEVLTHKPDAKTVLIIGLGAASITELVLQNPQIKKVTLVEISSSNLANIGKSPLGPRLKDPRLVTIHDDGRRILLSSKEKYDLILLDPLRATEAYSNNIYSREFFKLAKEHLSADGIMMLWLDEHHVIPNTVANVFDHLRVYNFFLIASNSEFKTDSKATAAVLANYTKDDIQNAYAHRMDYIGDRNTIKSKFGHYPINTDFKPVCEYFFGLNYLESLYRSPKKTH